MHTCKVGLAAESATHKLSALKAPALCFSFGSVNREQLLPERSFIRLCATTYMKCVTAKVVGIPLLSPINTYTQGIIVSSTSTTGSVWFWSLVVSLLWLAGRRLCLKSRREEGDTARRDCPGTRKCIFEPLRKYQSLSAPHAFVGGCERSFDRVRVLNY
jgi:hypothetical protein